jgi:hypothetical protein
MDGSRVFQVSLEPTFAGLRLWQLFLVLAGFMLGSYVQPAGAEWLGILCGAACAGGTLFLAVRLGARFQGEGLYQLVYWVFQAKTFLPGPDRGCKPVVVNYDRVLGQRVAGAPGPHRAS